MLRDRKSFLFLLIMPIAFTVLFGLVMNDSGQKNEDPRLLVGLVNKDGTTYLSLELERSLSASNLIRLEEGQDITDLEKKVAEENLAAAVIIPWGYDVSLRSNEPLQLIVLADPSTSAGLSAQTEIQAFASRLTSAVYTAKVIANNSGASFDTAMGDALAAWNNPPVRLTAAQPVISVDENHDNTEVNSNFTHSSPGMILQFAVAGLLTCAQVIVSERKNRCLQRLLTTSASRVQILLGHYLGIFLLIFTQFAILILFGQYALGLNYLSQPLATLLIMVTAAMCISALGLLIGVLAKGEEQAISFSLICMFLLAGLGGAWVPLEVTGKTFQAIGHISPLAWAMDGFKNVLIRGLDVSAAWLPALALLGYAALFFGLANWRFRSE